VLPNFRIRRRSFVAPTLEHPLQKVHDSLMFLDILVEV